MKYSSRNTSRLTLLLIFILSFSGCATNTKPLADDSVINSITINEKISMPEQLTYIGNSVSLGLIGVLAAGDKKQKEWEAHAAKHEISIDDIVFKAFENEMISSKRFPLEKDAKTQINIEIVSYGLTVPNGLSKKLHPTLLVKTQIFDQTDKILWEHTEQYASFSKESPLIEKVKLKENPNLLRDIWEAAAKNVAQQTISKI